MPVGLLDPDPLSIKTMNTDRGYSVVYLEYAHNCGGHWIAIIIIPKWQKVMYLDPNRGRKSDLSPLKSMIDE